MGHGLSKKALWISAFTRFVLCHFRNAAYSSLHVCTMFENRFVSLLLPEDTCDVMSHVRSLRCLREWKQLLGHDCGRYVLLTASLIRELCFSFAKMCRLSCIYECLYATSMILVIVLIIGSTGTSAVEKDTGDDQESLTIMIMGDSGI